MSEQHPNTNRHEQFELLTEGRELALPDAEHAEPLRPGEADPRERLEQARSVVEEESASSEKSLHDLDLQASEAPGEQPQPGFVSQALQDITVHRELQHIQRKLPAPERLLSRFVHRPAVRVASDVAGKSISRPSGLLGGGIVAFAGTLGYVYLARHVGFQYNYVVFTLLFVGGFAAGLALELLIWVAMRSRRHATE
ncbi:MAG TPA: hypothetical protein VHB72_01135 [Candidatus Saccharimonadales bacterium]|nr:hypothetical protein [Candidatus Saccharimonadales bacterium]